MSKKKTDCCKRSNIRAHWVYMGSQVERASAYCENCTAKWTYSHRVKRLVRVRKVTPPGGDGERK